jgi:hypothetical protein
VTVAKRSQYHRAMRWVAFVLVVACSGGKPSPVTQGPLPPPKAADAAIDVAPPIDAVTPVDSAVTANVALPEDDEMPSGPPMKSCPKTPEEAVGACAIGDATRACNFGDTVCSCRGYCGGRRPPVMPPPQWSCTPKPPKVREDGCPGAGVKIGQACSKAGLQCSYMNCCAAMFTCSGGKWKATGVSCPP